MDAPSLIQYAITGLTVGSTYGLTALGFTVIYNTTGVINFAQGEFVMLGGMASVYFAAVLGLPLALAVPLAVAVAVAFGLMLERFCIRPVNAGGKASTIRLIIITIGASIVIRSLVMLYRGKDTFALPAFTGNQPLPFLGASLLPQNLWVLGVSALLVYGLRLFFTRTLFGKGMLACSHDAKAAALSGIPVERMVMVSFCIAAAVGAAGGAVLAPITMTSYDGGILLGLKGFASCILGGLGNPFGAAAGGLIIGLLESYGAGFVSSAYKDAFAFGILLILLFVRPSGLFGAKGAKRV